MKRCFVVCGPESAGNRLLAAHLKRAGCFGNASTDQDYFPNKEPLAFIIRSFPHDGEWPDLKGIKRKLQRRGYSVVFLVPARDPFSLIRSQLKHGHQDCAYKAIETIRKAYQSACIDDYYLIPYEALTQGYDGFIGLIGLPKYNPIAGRQPKALPGSPPNINSDAKIPVRKGVLATYLLLAVPPYRVGGANL